MSPRVFLLLKTKPLTISGAEWNRFDTLVVCARLPTFLPFFEFIGVEICDHSFPPPHTDKLAIGHIVNMVTAVTRTNYMGPAVAAATFVSSLKDTGSIMLAESLC